MKIAFVHDWLTGMRGGEKCLEALCRRFPDARLYTLLHVRGSTSPTIERMRITPSFLQRFPRVSRYYRYLLPLMPTAVEHLSIERDIDLVVSLSHAVAKSVVPPRGVPHVCYCFTPMRYAWDMRDEYLSRPREINDPASMLTRAGNAAWNATRGLVLDRIREWDRRSADRVTHFVAISRTIAERIRRAYDRDSRVIYPPVDVDFYTPSDVPRDDFYLCVSALVPYKRLDLAVQVANALGRKLRIIGSGPEMSRLRKLAGPTVEFLGWQTDEAIRDALRRCRALLFPGHEDFGIVPVEAQACGTPVVAYDAGGATETLLPADEHRSGTARFFSEPSVEAVAEAILWLENHPRQLSANLARLQAERFSAARYERELVELLERAVNCPGDASVESPPSDQQFVKRAAA